MCCRRSSRARCRGAPARRNKLRCAFYPQVGTKSQPYTTVKATEKKRHSAKAVALEKPKQSKARWPLPRAGVGAHVLARVSPGWKVRSNLGELCALKHIRQCRRWGWRRAGSALMVRAGRPPNRVGCLRGLKAIALCASPMQPNPFWRSRSQSGSMLYAASPRPCTRSQVVALRLARAFMRASQAARLGWGPVNGAHSGWSRKRSICGATSTSASEGSLPTK